MYWWRQINKLGFIKTNVLASRIQWDLHKVDHYECYHQLDWEVQWPKEGFQHAEANKYLTN
jgi:NADH:ubiquinone oxidoreductase subunit D